ncbi:peptidoglycan-binding domain-containing protein [Streptomyces sp. NPDC048110]|uniref:peptidoglycan-binding domain-containing protein n=1 Tax=Streptomyces sp. NPDC048110 TaxID=3155483 RepID=UPI0033EE1189
MISTRRFTVSLSVLSLAVLGALGAPGAAQAVTASPSGTAANYCSEGWSQHHPTIGWGSAGNAVRHAQCKLGKWGRHVAIDGIFGRETYNATVALQRECGIPVDGIIGPQTWRCID